MEPAFYVPPVVETPDPNTLDLFAPAKVEVEVPEIRTPAPAAPGSESSRLAAEAIDGPFRRQSWRRIMLALGASSRPLSREEISERIGVKESSLCARLSELRPQWIESVSGACTSSAGVSVDGYQLTQAGRDRLKGAA